MSRIPYAALGAAAALALMGVYTAMERAESARAGRVDWPRVSEIASSRGYPAAEAFLDGRIAEHPRDALLHYYSARLAYEQGNAEKTLEAADRAIALGYAQEISHLLKALAYGRLLGDRAKELELAAKALSYDPIYDEGYLVRAEARYSLGDYAGCAADAAAYTRMSPKSADGPELSMLCLEALGDRDAAERAGLAVLKLKPNSHAALWRLGRISAARGQHARAAGKFSEAIRLSGGRPAYYLDRAASCSALGDYACAAWDYSAAMEWDGLAAYPTHQLRLASELYRAGELDDALAAASRAVEKAPALAAAYELRGRLRAEGGDLEAARRDLRAAAALEPAREAALALLPGPPGRRKK